MACALVVSTVAALGVLGFARQSAGAVGTTFTVNTTDVVNDHVCDMDHCSLLDAKDAADANPGKDTIAFNIPGSAPHVIHPRL